VAEEIIGNYRLVNCIATGQSSQVWEVVEQSSHRHFAMKILLPEKAIVGEIKKALYHEANVGQKLAHPNIIKIVHVSRDSKVPPHYVMEFFPAGSLKQRLLRKDMAFIKERAHSIFKQAATGLAYMNASGWVHRDIKPDNILVNNSGELRIIDFALAKRVQKGGFFSRLFRRRGPTQGTRTYMSPEQIRGLALDQRADIYSYGATVYELAVGRPPFRANSNQELLQKHIAEKPMSPQIHNPDITNEFADLALRCLAKKKEDRPNDFHEVLIKLRTIRVYKSDAAPDREGGM
jgi:serine/threonine-protein kinase